MTSHGKGYNSSNIGVAARGPFRLNVRPPSPGFPMADATPRGSMMVLAQG